MTAQASKLKSHPIEESHPTTGCGTAYENRFIAVDLVPSRFGPYTSIRLLGNGGVVVLVLWRGQVLMVTQPRYAGGLVLTELPRGGIEANETPQAAGAREVFEETGVRVTADNLVDLGLVIPDSGIMSHTVNLYAVHLPDEAVTTLVPDDIEITASAWVPLPALQEAIAAGEILDAFTTVTYTRALLRGLL